MVTKEQLNLFGIPFWGEPGLLGVPALVKTGSSGRRGHCALFAACMKEEGASSLPHWIPTVSLMECFLVDHSELYSC